MRVLDASFLIDYLSGVEAAAQYLQQHADEQFVAPAPVVAEVLVGEGNDPHGSVSEAKAGLSWVELVETRENTALAAGSLAEEIGPQGPYLDGIDAIVAAVGKRLDSTVVSADQDLTHPEVQSVISVDNY
ncbi:MAG: PIN domain protein, partial [halophilic archaeon J07HB67]